eukprot:CAMPEP_0183458302 /NCGR_PEP_ID=MMETSP0370-20130417/133234_1 /TAXON_ID=268820 /ORGANISM="Peridinium aciculiferum, Strain PAER-2" /LENGTH=124 /DNA_ID=CAMNT_0025650063 /DNA_START=196 /DNA_END=567 /DNA_ORIENTATION=+
MNEGFVAHPSCDAHSWQNSSASKQDPPTATSSPASAKLASGRTTSAACPTDAASASCSTGTHAVRWHSGWTTIGSIGKAGSSTITASSGAPASIWEPAASAVGTTPATESAAASAVVLASAPSP